MRSWSFRYIIVGIVLLMFFSIIGIGIWHEDKRITLLETQITQQRQTSEEPTSVAEKPHPHAHHINTLEKQAGTPLTRVAQIIMHDEGVRAKPYLDTRGNVTIGVGRSLTTNGISTEELHAIAKDIDYKHILSNTHVRNGRILIATLDTANRIFKEPLSKADIELLLADDLKSVVSEARGVFGVKWEGIDTARREAIINILYNTGLPHFKKFENFISSVKESDWKKAASDLLLSEAARRNVNRYLHIAAVIQTGDDKHFFKQ